MDDHWLWLAVLALLFGVLVELAWRWLSARMQTRRRRAVARRGRRGEALAVAMLERLGYVIEAEQPVQVWPIAVGDEVYEIKLRADFLVWHCGRRYVAEVKTGDLVASMRHGPTRRQLLEYQLAYGAQGVVLVDVLAGAVLSVRFPFE